MAPNPRRATRAHPAVTILLTLLAWLGSLAGAAGAPPVIPEDGGLRDSGPRGAAPPLAPLGYQLDLRHPETHLVGVTLTIPHAGPGTEIQFPAWNALYQIRDFIRNVQDLRAQCDGQAVALTAVDLETRRLGPASCAELVVDYQVYANGASPFGSVLDQEHGFFNLAMLLFYLPAERQRAIRVGFLLPPGWKLATLLDDAPEPGEFAAPDYDALADSPVEAGSFREYSYAQDGAAYRVIVHADPADYSPKRLIESLQRITATETALMQDVPFRRYTFIFHFRHGSGGGGMEHSDGTAISLPAETVRNGQSGLEAMAAHEFFHLWNVKRIRPQGLEPIDYVHGNDTSGLWFSEGVTSTYGEFALVRSGLIGRKAFYGEIAAAVQSLKGRPARRFQSVTESGREAWLEKYPDYTRPERSISYYDKGELLGYLLDLAIRHSTSNARSLDDVMRALNDDFAKRHRFFTEANLMAEIARLAPGFGELDDFFRNDVDGTADLDYQRYLGYAGLQLETRTVERAALGFVALQSFGGPVTVDSVTPGSEAEQAGLERGDVLVLVNGQPAEASADMESVLRAGAKIKLRVRRGGHPLELKFNTGRTAETRYRVTESPHPSPDQVALREGWLTGTVPGAGKVGR